MTKGKRKRKKAAPRRARTYWLDNPRNVDRLVYGLYCTCAVLVLFDMFSERHGPFAVEHVFGFYAIFGLVACLGLVLAAKELRKFIMRPENYYDR